jgi:hypothetical protein
MKKENIKKVTEEWIGMTHKVLDLKRIPTMEIRELFRKSYEVLNCYNKESLVPKELAEMLLEMDGFLYFAAFITDKEFDDYPYLYQAIHSVAEALKSGFFDGNYECEYPLLKVTNAEDRICVLDLEQGCIEELI